ANIKFENGRMKHLLKQTFSSTLPKEVLERKDKMGFPVPLTEWMETGLKEYVFDIMSTGLNRQDSFIDYRSVIDDFKKAKQFSRKQWGFLCYEVWQQQFHDQTTRYRNMVGSQSVTC
ncbi:MAG: asparagine synthase C-terminal domain-containing protein, partial [Gammaproteobacteria bacterium]|nr:asparagine synthase C-terminal domain-containing protein [Gammaproteobacteria bacterium]